jgi:hypothetical protein
MISGTKTPKLGKFTRTGKIPVRSLNPFNAHNPLVLILSQKGERCARISNMIANHLGQQRKANPLWSMQAVAQF